MNKVILILMFALIVLPFVSAEGQSLDSVKAGQTIQLIQNCENSTYSNITRVVYPDRVSFALDGQYSMQKSGDDYNYTYSDTSNLGNYLTYGQCDLNGVKTNWAYDFDVTPSGASALSSAQGTSLLIAMVVILVLSIIFFIMGLRLENIAGKIIFITLGFITLLILVLYTLLILNEAVAGSPTLVEGFENFYFILRILATVGFFTLLVIIALIMIRAWKIRRGFID